MVNTSALRVYFVLSNKIFLAVDEVECDSTLRRAVEARVVESQLPGLAICL